jgi:CRISPR-associated endonuclease/helicase Cas3
MSKYKHPILAKPSGITLERHTQNLMSEGALLVANTPFVLEKYQKQTEKSLIRRIEEVCKYHDAGKELSEKWQTACQQDYDNFLNWQLKNNGKSFNDYSAKNDAGANIRKAGVRHEFYSLKKNSTLPLVLQSAIAAHHGKLGNKFEDRWKNEGFIEFWGKFKKEFYRIIEKNSLEITAKAHYEFAGPRGLLQLADHRASAKEDGDFVPDISSFQYKFPHGSMRGVQKLVEKYWDRDLLLVRAPTGAGKTDASLLWASLQIQNRRAERLIIAMPTRFTSNALAINISESLSDTGLYHSSAWFSKFQDNVDNQLIGKQKADKIHEFARLLQTPVTVCTIDHLLMTLTLTREDHHLIAFNLANSCLVIDEADFYDDFTQANILTLLEILRYWNVPILLMSASLPESILPVYQRIGYKIDEIIEDTSDNKRIRFEIKEIREYIDVSELEDLLHLCVETGNAIIYANTVDKAVSFYDWFSKKEIKSILEKNGIKLMLYHSRYTEPHKKDKEQELINNLGKEAWGNGKASGIAVLTQIGEMSINISADIMISELCPIDRLTQRAGRMCRFDKTKIGELHVVVPQKNDLVYPAPYGEYDRNNKCWIPCEAFLKTAESIETTSYNAIKLVFLLNQIYPTQEYSSQAMNNAKSLKEYFSVNWLIKSKQETNVDDADTNFWKSRNILPQDTVFVEKPPTYYFRNHLEYQSWKIRNSIELPVFLIENGRKQFKIDTMTIRIRDEVDTIYVIREGFYNFAKGVDFREIDKDY